jgi:hypothetical protein
VTAITIEGLRTVSEANDHSHWRARSKRAKQQRFIARAAMRPATRPTTHAITIRLTRIAPRKLDSDNAVGALKHVRDGVADWLEINDGSERLTWLYAQEQATKRHAVCIELL